MDAMIRILSCLSALCLAAGLSACGSFESINKKPKFTVSLHAQGTGSESPRSVFSYTLPGQPTPTPFKLVPEISQENVSAFQSFPADNGNGFGVALRLDFRGTNSLDLFTRTHSGEVALAMVNGRPVDYLSIDRPVSDGVLTIWEGVPTEVIKLMAAKWPPINKLKSVSTGQEMVPSTKAEKRRSLSAAQEEMKAKDLEAKRKAANPGEQPSTLPPSPSTQQIPLEGNNQDLPLPPIKRP